MLIDLTIQGRTCCRVFLFCSCVLHCRGTSSVSTSREFLLTKLVTALEIYPNLVRFGEDPVRSGAYSVTSTNHDNHPIYEGDLSLFQLFQL